MCACACVCVCVCACVCVHYVLYVNCHFKDILIINSLYIIKYLYEL